MMRSAKLRSVRAFLAVSLAVLCVCGCGHSVPTHYFTLNDIPAQAPLSTVTAAPVQLTAVHIPAELDRPEVVTRLSGNRLKIDDNDRWGAPLAQMTRNTLAQDLLTRLPQGSFVFPDAPAAPGTRKLVVTVLDCKGGADGTLTVQAAWTLLSGQPAVVMLSGEVLLASPRAGGDAAAQAAALSRILGDLADRIAASITPSVTH